MNAYRPGGMRRSQPVGGHPLPERLHRDLHTVQLGQLLVRERGTEVPIALTNECQHLDTQGVWEAAQARPPASSRSGPPRRRPCRLGTTARPRARLRPVARPRALASRDVRRSPASIPFGPVRVGSWSGTQASWSGRYPETDISTLEKPDISLCAHRGTSHIRELCKLKRIRARKAGALDRLSPEMGRTLVDRCWSG